MEVDGFQETIMWKRPTFDPTACLQARRRSGSVSLILFSTPSRQRRNQFSTFCEGVFHSTIKISNGISSQKSNSLHACSQLKSLSILQTKLPGKGCIRSPVAHCKLNPIELVWFNVRINDITLSHFFFTVVIIAVITKRRAGFRCVFCV